MKIDKIINNNVVCVINGDGREKIVMGKGIGFSKKIGDEVEVHKIEKIFVLSNQDQTHKFIELVNEIPLQYMFLADDIINYAKSIIGKKMDDYVYIGLVDHIYTAIKRANDGLLLPNAMHYDIKRFYADEFKIGEFAIELIKNEMGVELPKDEIGFIALHIVNATSDANNVAEIVAITELIQQLTNIVKYEFKVEFDDNSLSFYRFITHLKFFAKRIIENKTYPDESDYDFFKMICHKYHNSYNCVLKIKQFLLQNYNHELTNEEALYLTIHIERVIYKK